MHKARLYLDENVPVLLAEKLKEHGFDTTTARDNDMIGRSDPDNLACAVRLQRSILTFDRADFLALAESYAKQNKEHFGIILSTEIPFREILRRTLKLIWSISPDDLKNNVIWLNNFK